MSAPKSPAVHPVRPVHSEAELGALAADSIVCGVHDPGYVFQSHGDGGWSEPGNENVWSTEAVWEFLTGAHETIVLDEDREAWLLYDAALKHTLPVPTPANPSHGWVSGVHDRNPVWVTHETVDEARARIQARLADGPSDLHMQIAHRSDGQIDFHPVAAVRAGTTELEPWQN